MRTTVAMATGLLLLVSAGRGAADDLKKSMAKRHFETGSEYYKTANYEAALDEFEKAYGLFPVPTMLFNIGRCYEALGRLKQAVDRYEEYLRKVPDTKDRETLEERIRNIRRRIDDRAAPAPAPAEVKAGPSGPDDVARPDDGAETDATVTAEGEPASGGRTWKIVGWSAVGVGAASLLAAGILGGMALSKTADYEKAYEEHETYADAKQTLDSAESLETGSFVALGVGLAAAAAGALVLVLTRDRPTGTDEALRLRPTAGGLAVQF